MLFRGVKIVNDENSLDDRMARIADLFAGRVQGDEEILHPDRLARPRLDFTLESLDVAGGWLEAVFADGFDGSADQDRALLWAGAYLGEVIRRRSPRPYRWHAWDDFLADEVESVRDVIPRSFTTQFLLACPGGVILPINQVHRFVQFGPKHDLRAFAAALCPEPG